MPVLGPNAIAPQSPLFRPTLIATSLGPLLLLSYRPLTRSAEEIIRTIGRGHGPLLYVRLMLLVEHVRYVELPVRKFGRPEDAVPFGRLAPVLFPMLLHLLPLVPRPVVHLLHVPRAGPMPHLSAHAMPPIRGPRNVIANPPASVLHAKAQLIPPAKEIIPLEVLPVMIPQASLVSLIQLESALLTAIPAHVDAAALSPLTLLKTVPSLEVPAVVPQHLVLPLLLI